VPLPVLEDLLKHGHLEMPQTGRIIHESLQACPCCATKPLLPHKNPTVQHHKTFNP
jgi:hypothetical protein